MVAMLVLAMVLSAAGMHAWEQGKARSTARWDEARRRAAERGAARERDRQQAAAKWEARFDSAISRGPRHVLWWMYAVGYLAGGAVAAVGAGAVGAYSGAVAGGKSGYVIGLEAGRKGRGYREAWRDWKHRNRGETVELAQCERCAGWVRADEVTQLPLGWVCPDCVPQPTTNPGESPDPEPERDPHDQGSQCRSCARQFPPLELDSDGWCRECADALHSARGSRDEEAQESNDRRWKQRCDGRCQNSNYGPTEAMKRGLCPDCGGRCELITNFGGEHKHVPCPGCKGSGKYSGPPPKDEPQEPIRVNAERIYPEPEEEPQPKEITNTMNALPSAHSNDFAGTGEGYTDTVQDLESLAKLMSAVQEKVTSLNEMLTANSLDAETLNRLSELTDGIESVTTEAQQLHKHVVDRHNPMADATASAGGSSNVATKTYYDDY